MAEWFIKIRFWGFVLMCIRKWNYLDLVKFFYFPFDHLRSLLRSLSSSFAEELMIVLFPINSSVGEL